MAQPDPKVLTFDVVGTLIAFEAGMLGYLRRTCGPAAAELADAADAGAIKMLTA